MWRHSPAASLTYPTWGSLRRARDPLSGSWQGRDPTSDRDESQRSEKPGGILLVNDWNCQAFLSSQQPAVSYQQPAARRLLAPSFLESSQHETQENHRHPDAQVPSCHPRHPGFDGTPLLLAEHSAAPSDQQGGKLAIHRDALRRLEARHQQKSEHLDRQDLPKALREVGAFLSTDKDGQGARDEQKLHRPRHHELIAPARGVRDLDLFPSGERAVEDGGKDRQEKYHAPHPGDDSKDVDPEDQQIQACPLAATAARVAALGATSSTRGRP